VRGVRQIHQRGRELEGDLPFGGDADGLVAEPFAGLTVGLEEAPLGLPAGAPLLLGEPGGIEVVTGGQQPFPAPHHTHALGLPVPPDRLQPVGEHVQTARFRMPLPPARIPARGVLVALLAHRQRQPVRDHPHPRFQALEVCELTPPGQRPSCVAFVILPAQREDDTPVTARLRATHPSLSWSRPTAHRVFRSREASAPR
jgi:hypothetical protein